MSAPGSSTKFLHPDAYPLVALKNGDAAGPEPTASMAAPTINANGSPSLAAENFTIVTMPAMIEATYRMKDATLLNFAQHVRGGAEGGLILLTNRLSGPGMDKMNLVTGKAGHGLIRMITIPNGIIGKPGLHVLAGTER